MQQINKTDLVGSWHEKAVERNGEIRPSTETSSQWIFFVDGKAIYKYTNLKTLITNMDNRERFWDLKFEGEEIFIVIQDESSYKIISLNENILIAENMRNGLRYHFEKGW